MMDGGSTDDEAGTAVDPIGADVRADVGGKGVNVAVVLKRLGVPVGCVGCLGERGRESFLKMIHQEDVPFDYLPMPGEVRTRRNGG